MAARPGVVRRFLGGLWSLLDFTRRFVLNLLFLGVVVALLVAWFAAGRQPALKEQTALVLDLRGELLEQYRGSRYDLLLADAFGDLRAETQLRDVVRALDAAAKDPAISRVALVLDNLTGGGTPSLREVAAALARFRASGKQVIAWGSGYSQRQYFLAAHADEVYLHPQGEVELRGFGGSAPYFKEALDRLGVTVHGYQAGRYKNVFEPLTRSAPSPEALDADRAWLQDAWSLWTADVERARKLEAGHIDRLIDALPQRMAAVKGDAAQLALQERLVDGLKTRDEFRALMIERGAPADEKRGTFRQIALQAYLGRTAEPTRGDAVGVIVAEGEILNDSAPPGAVGGRATAELIRRAREDDAIRALVLRIDSPGGTPFGSELIRREVELTRKAGKPVIASMGDMAASGGYWIAMSADEIHADPATVTGSIGVAGLAVRVDRALDKLGVGAGGAHTTWLAGASSPLRPMDRRLAELTELRIGHLYRAFIEGAAAGRGTTPEKIDAVAQGRVWTGRQALEHGLVDQLSGFHQTLQAAARKAGLPEDFRVVYIEREPRAFQRWLSLLTSRLAVLAQRQLGLPPALPPEVREPLRLIEEAAADPHKLLAHCFCQAP